MYLAEEITSKNHQFNHQINHSRKKPSSKVNSEVGYTHHQEPLFADMLHETDIDQKERAHNICGSTTIYNMKGAARLFCGRRDCPYCFKRRYRKIARKIRAYADKIGQKLYCQKIYEHQRSKLLRSIKARNGEYACFPVINEHGIEKEYIISNVIDGTPVHMGHPSLEACLAVWTRTPEGRKISFSSGFRLLEHVPYEKLPQFFGKVALPKILPHAVAVGGIIRRASKSYVQWEVDPEKLTARLVENDIVAYQISMEKTLFEDSRNAEDIEAKTDFDKTDFDAVPLNSKGKAIAPPVKLRQLLNKSIGTGLHKIPSVTPLHNDKAIGATSPPPG